jgi:hypothetical protein
MYQLLELAPGFEELRPELPDVIRLAEGISRQLRAWADSLQNSDIRGQRYLTDKSRRLEQQRREREEFLAELEEIRNRNKS